MWSAGGDTIRGHLPAVQRLPDPAEAPGPLTGRQTRHHGHSSRHGETETGTEVSGDRERCSESVKSCVQDIVCSFVRLCLIAYTTCLLSIRQFHVGFCILRA